jgi:alpha-galactosidase
MREVTMRIGDAEVARADAEARPAPGGMLLPGASVRVDFPGTPVRVYRHGWQSWSQTRWLAVDEPVAPIAAFELRALDDDPVHATAARQGGAAFGALEDGSGTVLLVGAAGIGGRVEVDAGGLEATSDVVDEWFVAVGTEPEVFGAYADILGATVGRRTLPGLRVWCSWYSFYRDITEPALDDVLADLDGLSFDVFQVDDGWQRHIGDWQVNETSRRACPRSRGGSAMPGCGRGCGSRRSSSTSRRRRTPTIPTGCCATAPERRCPPAGTRAAGSTPWT